MSRAPSPAIESEQQKNNSSAEEESDEDRKRKLRLRKRPQVKYYQSDASEDEEASKTDTSDSNSSSEDDEEEDSDFEMPGYRKKSSREKKKSPEKEQVSEYEKHLKEKRAKNIEFLQSLGIDEVKNGLKRPKRPYAKRVKRIEIPDTDKRVSERSKKHVNYTEEDLAEISVAELDQKPQAEEISFKEAIEKETFYEKFEEDFKDILEADICVEQKPVLYNKEVLKQMTETTYFTSEVSSASPICWHPSAENLLLANGCSNGKLNLFNIMEPDSALHTFNIHSSKKVSHLQFNPYNTFQLISSGYDGTLLCCDIQKQIFSQVLNTDRSLTHFDFLSPTSYIVSLANGKVIIADQRTKTKKNKGGKKLRKKVTYYKQQMHTCHDSFINTVNVHPVNKNYFVSAGRDKKICVWDVRNSLDTPVFENANYKKSVACALFSPVTGKFLLTKSDRTLSIFDCTYMTEGSLERRKIMKLMLKSENCSVRPLWLPNSDDTFACCSYQQSTSSTSSASFSPAFIVYDKDFNIYERVQDGVDALRKCSAFHPFKTALATGTGGRIIVST